MNKEHKLRAASVEFGEEFGDFNAAKHYETPFNKNEHNKKQQKSKKQSKKA